MNTKGKVCTLKRIEIVQELKRVENGNNHNVKEIEKKLKWLGQQLDLKMVDEVIFYSETIKKSRLSYQQYICFQDALYGLSHNDLSGAYHQFCDFISNRYSELEIDIMEVILIKIWVDLFKREYKDYLNYGGKSECQRQIEKPNLRHIAAEIIQSQNLYNEVSIRLGCTAEKLKGLLQGYGCFTNEQARKLCEILEINPLSVCFRWED